MKTEIHEDSEKLTEAIEWHRFAFSYLQAAEVLLRQADEHKKILVLVPAIFSIRHGIELLLKFIRRVTGLDIKRGHKINNIFNTIKERLQNIDETQIKEISIKLDIDPKIFKEYFEISSKKIESVVYKYHYWNFLKRGEILDEQNEIFRYPVLLKTGIPINRYELVKNISIEEAMDDIKHLTMFLGTLLIFAKDEDGLNLIR